MNFRWIRLMTLSCLVAALAPAMPGLRAAGTLPSLLAWEGTIQLDAAGEIRWPMAIAAASDDEFAVADAYRPRIVIFHRKGGVWLEAGSMVLPAVPRAMAHDGIRYLVALRGEPRLLAVEGEQHQYRNLPLPDRSIPGALAGVHGGGFLLHDLAGGRILRLGPRGGLDGVIPMNGTPGALASATGGGFYAAFPETAMVRRYDRNGRILDEWRVPGEGPTPAWPAGFAVEPGGDLLIVDRHSGRLVVLDASGRPIGRGARRGWDPGLLLFPGALARLSDGLLLVADQGNGRVQMYRRIKEESGR